MSAPDAPRPNRRQLAKAATRAKVLVAAGARFDDVGYAAATIRDIAADAGMSTGAVFASFEDKAALWRAATGAAEPEPCLADELARTVTRWPGASLAFTPRDVMWAFAVYDAEVANSGSRVLAAGTGSTMAAAVVEARRSAPDRPAQPMGAA